MLIGVFGNKKIFHRPYLVSISILKKKKREVPLLDICRDDINKTSQVGVLLKEKINYNKKWLSKVEFQIAEGQTAVAIHKQNKPDLGVTFEDDIM